MIKNKLSNKKGFTLIELMVSISIFTMVAIVALGAIITIIDANRKARTLSTIMNNLNFSVESMTRSVKTGSEIKNVMESSFEVKAIDFYAEDTGSEVFPRKWITYRKKGDAIERCDGTESAPSTNKCFPITSDQIKITYLGFYATGELPTDSTTQPRIRIVIEGETKTQIRGTGSKFKIQTTVSQRKLDR